MTKDPSQGPGYVIGSQLGRRDLVQQRLELVIVVAVKQDHVDVMFGELLGAADSGEPASHNDHSCEHCWVTHPSSPLSDAVGRWAGRINRHTAEAGSASPYAGESPRTGDVLGPVHQSGSWASQISRRADVGCSRR